MINSKRRQFLHRSSMLVASSALTACGGGGSAASGAAAGAMQGAAADTFASTQLDAAGMPLPAATVDAVTLPNARFSLVSPRSQSNAPYTLGFAFRRGDVPAGKRVVADVGQMQCTVKNAWPDGSVKFAVLAGQTALTAGMRQTVNLRVASVPFAADPNVLTTARLANVTADIDCGVFGRVHWEGADWGLPFSTWVSGPAMSSWIYRKPVASDRHLVAWLEVRVYAGGAVELLPWVENGMLRVSAPTNKAATYGFWLNGTLRMSATFDLKHHQRTPLVAGRALSYWLGADPEVTPRHDTAYLQATELVPTYQARVNPAAPVVTALVSSFTPLQAGNFNYYGDDMTSSGYQDSIGLLPQHDVLYLTSDADAAYGAVVRNGFSAGRYGIHYRDETTNRPLRFSRYPTLNIGSGQGFKDTGGSTREEYTPTPSGGNPPVWDVAHSPSVGYMAYLITGRWYFMEEVQFATTANYLGNGDNTELRTGSLGLVQTAIGAWQTRSCAWDWRARVQALCVTPDDDIGLHAELVASVEANIDHFHRRYVAQPNNPYGWIKPGEGYDDTIRIGSPWQQDFVTAAFGFSLSLGLPLSMGYSDKLKAFFLWKARSVVGRLGTRDKFWYVNAVPYTVMISPSIRPDYDTGAGPWYATDAEVYNATYANLPAWLGKVDGVLSAEYLPGERALWGNLQPALAYAVRHGAAGAVEAYKRMTSASNWNTLAAAFNQSPVWSVTPYAQAAVQEPAPVVPVAPPPSTAPAGSPAWMVSRTVGQWIEIANTAGAGGAAADAYSGFAFNEQTSEIMIALAGGHMDSSDNRVVSLRLADNVPTWFTRSASSAAPAIDVAYYADGKPAARHTYSTTHFIPQLNRLMTFGVRFSYGNAYTFAKVDGFDVATNTWDAAGTYTDAPTGHYGAVSIRGTGEVWTNALARWSPVTRTWTQPITQRSNDNIRWPIAHDAVRNQLFSLNFGDGEGYGVPAVFASRVPLNGNAQISVSFNPSAALTSFIADRPTYSAMDFDPDNDRFLFYCGQDNGAGRIYVVKPNSSNVWDMSIMERTGTVFPPATPGAGVQNRFRYVPALKGFVLMPSGRSNVFFMPTA